MTCIVLIPTLPEDSGLCRRQVPVTFQAAFPHPPPSSSVSHTPDVRFACLQKGEIHSLALSPSLPPFPSSQPGRAPLSTVSRRRRRGGGSQEERTSPRFYLSLEARLRCGEQFQRPGRQRRPQWRTLPVISAFRSPGESGKKK